MRGHRDFANPGREPLLGYLFWYSISGLVTQADLKSAFLETGLNLTYRPTPIRPPNAFRSTIASLNRSTTSYPLAIGGQTGELSIVLGSSDTESMTYHVMREVRDSRREKRQSDKVGELHFYRGRRVQTGRVAGTESTRAIMRGGLPDLDRAQVQALFKRFDAEYEKLTNFRDASDVRSILRALLQSANAIAVKPAGALYFVGTEHQGLLDAMQAFVKKISTESSFWQVPLIDSEDQRDMLGEAFCTQLIEESDSLVGAISKYIGGLGKDAVAPSRYADFREQYENILARREDALNRLDRSDARAESSLTLLYEAITDLTRSAHARRMST